MKELDIRRYIIENINQNYNGYVNTKLSYNSNRYGDINYYLMEIVENLLAIYFDWGKRELRDVFYDYINLRW